MQAFLAELRAHYQIGFRLNIKIRPDIFACLVVVQGGLDDRLSKALKRAVFTSRLCGMCRARANGSASVKICDARRARAAGSPVIAPTVDQRRSSTPT